MNEIYLYKKADKLQETINVGMSYPSTYYYGMSVLGFLNIFKEFDMNPDVSTQRIFLNTKALAFSVNKLDLLGFSCIFEYDILQIFKILKKYNIKLEAEKRRSKAPIIFAGGPVITSNPEPFADFFDFMIIGDGENIPDKIVEIYKKNKNKTKKEILKALSAIDGIYVPSLYEVKYNNNKICAYTSTENNVSFCINKKTSNSNQCLYSPIISENTFYANTAFIEIERGCPYECKFCSAHWQNMPCRYFDIASIKKAIKKAAKYAKRITFIGAMISAHPDFNEICMYIKKMQEKYKFTVEFSSMDFDNFAPLVPEILAEKTISLAIECGSEKLRFETNKNLTDEKIYQTIDFYKNHGISKFNLYFLYGLPDETQEDIDKYIAFSVKLAKNFPVCDFNHILSTFIPKPATPYEREKRKNNAYLKSNFENIKNIFEENNISVNTPVFHNDNFNSLISLADRRIGKFLKHIFEKNIPVASVLKEYKLFMKKYNSNSENEIKIPHYSFYIYRKKDEHEILPWDFVKYN